MKMKILLLIFLAVLSSACLTTAENSSKSADTHPEKNENTFPKATKKEPKPPNGLKLSSILYNLATALEPEEFAKKNDIFVTTGKVRVFISFKQTSSISERDKLAENYNFMVEKKSNDLCRALVPIDRLIPLSKESAIWSIRLPDKAIKERRSL